MGVCTEAARVADMDPGIASRDLEVQVVGQVACGIAGACGFTLQQVAQVQYITACAVGSRCRRGEVLDSVQGRRSRRPLISQQPDKDIHKVLARIAAYQQVVAGASGQQVRARSRVEGVVAAAADQHIGARARRQVVVATAPENDVVSAAGVDGVGAVATGDVFVGRVARMVAALGRGDIHGRI